MNTHADKTQENKNEVVGTQNAPNSAGSESTFQFVDNRTETVSQRKIQEMANNNIKVNQLRAFQQLIGKASMKTSHKQDLNSERTTHQGQFTNSNLPVQRVPVSNAKMNELFSDKKGIEWFYWGPGGNHVGAIRPENGTGEVTDFHVKKEFKGAKTNRIDWLANDNTYNEVAPPTKLEYNNEESLTTMRKLGEETKNLLVKNKK